MNKRSIHPWRVGIFYLLVHLSWTEFKVWSLEIIILVEEGRVRESSKWKNVATKQEIPRSSRKQIFQPNQPARSALPKGKTRGKWRRLDWTTMPSSSKTISISIDNSISQNNNNLLPFYIPDVIDKIMSQNLNPILNSFSSPPDQLCSSTQHLHESLYAFPLIRTPS